MTAKSLLSFAALLLAPWAAGLLNAAGPAVFGDGVHDDTDGIQAALDSGTSTVHLPPTAKHYLISRTLRIHSQQTLRLDLFTVIRLAPKSDCLMITNDDHERGNQHVAVIGGIWDMDNVHQSPNPIKTLLAPNHGAPVAYDPARYLGVCMRFVGVEHLTLREITFRDPVTFCTQLARLRHFTIDDITFDYRHSNPEPGFNMDGIHIEGNCRFGRISNLKGRTNDDLVALNADDDETVRTSAGPIEDITIDGIYAEDCHSAVRLLSTGSPVRRISISNVHGTYYRYAIGLTKFFHRRPTPGVFEDISLHHLHCAKAPRHARYQIREGAPIFSLVHVEKNVTVGRLSVEQFHRDERAVAVPSVEVAAGATVETLQISHHSIVNHTPQPLDAIVNHGAIGTLLMEDVTNTNGQTLVNHGTIQGKGTSGN